jgi:Anti-sigma factor NepR
MNKGKPPQRRPDMTFQGSGAQGPQGQGPQGSETKPVLGPDIKAKIGRQLGLMYGEIIKEGVPDRFADILRGLDDPPDAASPEGSKKGFEG